MPIIADFGLPSRLRRVSPPILLAGLLLGCTVGPDFQAPTAPQADRFTEAPALRQTASAATSGGAAQILDSGADVPGAWWEAFRSPQVTDLVTRALRANPDVTAAQATLREAIANSRAEEGGLFPQLGLSASGTREHEPGAALGEPGGGSTFGLYSGSLNVSYTLDTFGGTRRQIEALDAQADYQRFELEATELTLAANTVDAAINVASLQEQIATTQSIIATASAALDVMKQRFDLGGVSRVDVLQQQSLVDDQVATLPGLQKQLQQARHQLAVYLGARPSDAALPGLDLATLTLPETIPVSLPSKLVEQRPDIRAYESLLHAATAQVGVATANMLPQISLTGSYGRDANSVSNLFSPAGILWSVAGSLSQPLFDGGTLSAKREAAKAALQVAAAQYSSTVNTAFANVGNALVAIDRDAEALKTALAAEETDAESLKVAKAQYEIGAVTYLSVLTAEQTDQTARLNVVTARATRFTDTVALFQALGGGWWNRTDIDPQIAQCCGVLP
jgi:NodT family efflux transporter outer membrane factor (OMF) lipoprotein